MIAKIESKNISPSYMKTKAIFDTLESLERTNEMKAKDICHGKVVSVQVHEPISKAVHLMRETGFSQLPVFNGNQPIGSLTEKTILQKLVSAPKPDIVSKGEIETIMDEALPTVNEVTPLSMVSALVYMFALDIGRVFRVAQMRRHALPLGRKLTTLGGLLQTRKPGLEKVIEVAREEASLSKRIVFLARSRQVFNLWHVVHKPFSYSFAALALAHIVVVTMLGFVSFLR
jgi:hypothetical protein